MKRNWRIFPDSEAFNRVVKACRSGDDSAPISTGELMLSAASGYLTVHDYTLKNYYRLPNGAQTKNGLYAGRVWSSTPLNKAAR